MQQRRSLVLLAVALLVVTCGADPAAGRSPVDTTYGYFAALNWSPFAADGFLAADSVLRGDSFSGGDRDFVIANFQGVVCRPAAATLPDIVDTATRAVVLCEFDVREYWSGFSPGHYHWGVWLKRELPGPWLIYDWGVPIGPW